MGRLIATSLALCAVWLCFLAMARPDSVSAQAATCPPNAIVRVNAPAPADKNSTVSVAVSPNIALKNPSAGDPQSFQLDYFVDSDVSALKPGQAVPTGNAQIIHTDAKKLDLRLNSGPHTVAVVLCQANDVPCRNADGTLVFGATQFTVPAGAGANETAATHASNNGTAAVVAVLVVILLLLAALAYAYYSGMLTRFAPSPGPRRRF